MTEYYWDYNGNCVIAEDQLRRDHERLVESGDCDVDFGHYLFEAMCKAGSLKYLGQFDRKEEAEKIAIDKGYGR